MIDGGHEVNEVFFDDVRVPAENLVGEENKGWDYAKFLLGNERIGIARVGVSKERLRRIKELAATRAHRRRAADRRPALPREARRGRDRAEGAGDDAAARRRGRAPSRDGKPDPGLLDAQDQGHGAPAGDDRAADGGRRPLRPALPARARATAQQRAADRPRLGRRRSRRPTSTGARSRSTAAPTRSSATSSPRRSWGSDSQDGRAWTSTSTDEQRAASKDTSTRLIGDRLRDFEQRKALSSASPQGWSRDAVGAVRRARACSALPFAEEHGGFGGGAGRDHDRHGGVRPRARARALSRDRRARRRLPAPRRRATQQRAELIPRIAAGELTLAFAHTERQSRYDLHDVATTAQRDGAGWVLDGEKGVVAARRQRRQARRHRAHRRRPARPRRHRRCSWSTPTRRACRGAATRPRTGSAPPRSRSRTSASAPEAVLGDAGRRAAARRARRRRGDRGALRRGRRRDGRDARADRRLPQDAQAVRRRRSASFQALQHRAADMSSRSSRRAAWRCSRR